MQDVRQPWKFWHTVADDDIKLSGAREITCVSVCVCVCTMWASKNAFHNCLWLNATLKQLFVRPTVNGYDDDVGGDAFSDGGEWVEEALQRNDRWRRGGEMFSVIEPVHGMSTVKFISYNIIFYVRVWFLHTQHGTPQTHTLSTTTTVLPDEPIITHYDFARPAAADARFCVYGEIQ